MNFAMSLTGNKVPGVKVNVTRLPDSPEMIAKLLLSRNATATTRAAIEKAVAEQKEKTPALVAGLVIGSPDFQRK
jgi:hypothetical protein